MLKVAVLLGLLMLAEALGLPVIGWHWFDLADSASRLQTFTFETLLFFALFSILSIRERRAFWASRPSTTLAVALFVDACAGVLISVYGLAELRPLSPIEMATIIGYALVFSLGINDFIKSVLIARGLSTR